MIVSTIETTALDSASPGTGAGAPIVGISPANVDTERMQISATVIRNLLIDVSPLR
jgi:hypothetical protein